MFSNKNSKSTTLIKRSTNFEIGLWESAKLNNRGQVTELNLGHSPTDGSMWKLNYDYGTIDANGVVDATKNSGNIAKQTVSFTGLAQPFVQTYKYDSLDRIAEAKETNNGNQTWIQNFGYDRYGNRTGFTQNVNGQQMPINNYTLPSVDANTNRIQTGQGYNYDNGGNLIQDADGTQFTFDGDNKQTEVKNASNVVIGKYYYDGNGKRVKKVTNAETTVFVYDGSGKLIAEYSNATPVQNPTVNYTATDPLGSPRVITNKQGEIVSRRDFMPFGEQLLPDVSYRTTNLKYNYGDNIRQKFTGYQRDEETGLDFAEARYYNNKHGRFTAVDPLLASGKSVNPQTFNRYAYVMSNPLRYVDPSGLCSAPTGLQPGQVGICFEAFIKTPRINGVGHGDNRGFDGNDSSKTARISVWVIVSTDETTVSANKTKEKVSSSVASVPTLTIAQVLTGGSEVSLPASANTNAKVSNINAKQGEKDFGEGIDVTVSITNGTNGAQKLGKDTQTEGAMMAIGSPGLVGKVVGSAVNLTGQAIEAASPPGTIDGNVTLRISGSGQVNFVSGESRSYPSYAVYAYTVGADGNPQTIFERTRPEGKPEDLPKPMTPFP